MPRRNRRQDRRRRPFSEPPTTAAMTTEEMARSLVLRGLAPATILGSSRWTHVRPEHNTAQNHHTEGDQA
jgi:hypothetical protein